MSQQPAAGRKTDPETPRPRHSAGRIEIGDPHILVVRTHLRGVVVQDIDPAEALDHVGHQPAHGVLVRDVHGEPDRRIAACGRGLGRHGRTIGSPIAMIIANRDWKNWTESMPVEEGDPEKACRPKDEQGGC